MVVVEKGFHRRLCYCLQQKDTGEEEDAALDEVDGTTKTSVANRQYQIWKSENSTAARKLIDAILLACRS